METQKIFVNNSTEFTNYKQLRRLLINSGVFFGIGSEIWVYIRKYLQGLLNDLVLVGYFYSFSTVFSDLKNQKEYLYD